MLRKFAWILLLGVLLLWLLGRWWATLGAPLPGEIPVQQAPNNIYVMQDYTSFSMDPNTVLISLRQGNANVFTQGATANQPPYLRFLRPYARSSPSSKIAWTQEDFFTVADALKVFAWPDDMKWWNVYSVEFFKPCTDSSGGFGQVDILYLKREWGGGSLENRWRGISIVPEYPGGFWSEDVYDSALKHWEKIDFRDVHITAEEALRIADERGAWPYRRQLNDKACELSLRLEPESLAGWLLIVGNANDYLAMTISPQSGEVLSCAYYSIDETNECEEQ